MMETRELLIDKELNKDNIQKIDTYLSQKPWLKGYIELTEAVLTQIGVDYRKEEIYQYYSYIMNQRFNHQYYIKLGDVGYFKDYMTLVKTYINPPIDDYWEKLPIVITETITDKDIEGRTVYKYNQERLLVDIDVTGMEQLEDDYRLRLDIAESGVEEDTILLNVVAVASMIVLMVWLNIHVINGGLILYVILTFIQNRKLKHIDKISDDITFQYTYAIYTKYVKGYMGRWSGDRY